MKPAHSSVSLILLALSGLSAPAQAETRLASPAHTLACPATSGGITHGEPGELVRELYRLLSGWCLLSATWDGEAARHAAIRDWAGLSATPKP